MEDKALINSPSISSLSHSNAWNNLMITLIEGLEKTDIRFVELKLEVSKAYFHLDNIPESWIALTAAQTAAASLEISPEIQEALDIQTAVLHAADERDFKNIFLHSKRTDRDALKRLSERPNFYTDVYFMIKPKVCYSKHARKFFDLVDIVLSSSHVPIYIVAAFVKRLSRVLLYAPLFCQQPIISIIKNILHRHRSVHEILINRAEPGTVDKDPYDENERDLKKCCACDSSLWELRSIQQHWYPKVAEKANFIDRNVQTDEVSVQWKKSDDIFDDLIKHCTMKLRKQEFEANRNKRKNGEENADEVDVNSDDNNDEAIDVGNGEDNDVRRNVKRRKK